MLTYHNSSVFAGDHGLQSVEEGENEKRVSGYAGFRRLGSKTDEPGEAKDGSTLAQTGHVEVPQALARGAPYY